MNLLHAIALRDEQALASLYDRYRLILFGLLIRVGQRDRQAFSQLYDRYAAILYTTILRVLNHSDEASDVLQEVFLQVWRRAADFDERRGRAFTWLITLARSRAIDRLRQLGSRERLALSAIDFVDDVASSPVRDALRSEQRQIVAGALAELSEEQRRALTLAYFEGLTQTEIAARLSSPLGTVKTRMRSGMIKLRELLSQRLESRAF